MELVIETPDGQYRYSLGPLQRRIWWPGFGQIALFAELLVEEHVANPEPAFRLYPRNPEVSPIFRAATDCLQDSGAWRLASFDIT